MLLRDDGDVRRPFGPPEIRRPFALDRFGSD